MHLTLEFGGGLELLLEKSTKVHKVDVQPNDGQGKVVMKYLLSWVKSNLIKERPEMFLKGDSVVFHVKSVSSLCSDFPNKRYQSTGKLEPRARKCIFVGYDSSVKGYRLWCSDAHKLIISRDVTFSEDVFLSFGSHSSTIESETNEAIARNVEFEVFLPIVDADSDSSVAPASQHVSSSSSSGNNDHCIARGRARRNAPVPARYRDTDDMACYALLAAQDVHDTVESSSYSEAISCENFSKWLTAMNEEIESLRKNHTWNLAKLPSEGLVFWYL